MCKRRGEGYGDSGDITSSSSYPTSLLERNLQQHEPEPPPLQIFLRRRFRLSSYDRYCCLYGRLHHRPPRRLLRHRYCYRRELAANVVT